jgi:hypothetical protein
MQTKQKSNSVVTHEVSGDIITFHVVGAGDVVLNMAAVDPVIAKRAAFHGMIQRLSDAAAIPRNPETGQPASPEEKRAAIAALADHYASGTMEWNRKRASGEGAVSGGLLRRALEEMYPGKDIPAFLKGKTKAEQAALRASAKVAPIIARMQSEAVKGIDVEAMLEDL